MRPINDVLEILIFAAGRFFQFVICERYCARTRRPRFGQHGGIISSGLPLEAISDPA